MSRLPNLQKLVEQATPNFPNRWQYARLIAAAPAMAQEITQDESAFSEIAEQQQKALSIARTHGFVFDDIGSEPGNWQHLAFTYYTMLCEIDSIARAALARLADFDRRIA